MPQNAPQRWRPLVPVTLRGPAGVFITFARALVDSGADDTIFPMDAAIVLGIPLLPVTGHAMRWRGQRFALHFAEVELELADGQGSELRWSATVAFSAANIRYPLLGLAGCLEYLDARFRGQDRILEIEPTAALPTTSIP